MLDMKPLGVLEGRKKLVMQRKRVSFGTQLSD
jgi:hypothetical protein